MSAEGPVHSSKEAARVAEEICKASRIKTRVLQTSREGRQN